MPDAVPAGDGCFSAWGIPCLARRYQWHIVLSCVHVLQLPAEKYFSRFLLKKCLSVQNTQIAMKQIPVFWRISLCGTRDAAVSALTARQGPQSPPHWKCNNKLSRREPLELVLVSPFPRCHVCVPHLESEKEQGTSSCSKAECSSNGSRRDAQHLPCCVIQNTHHTR